MNLGTPDAATNGANARTSGTHVRWPASRFYWSILDSSNLPNGRPNASQLGYLLENVLPVSIDQVHAVFLPLGENRHLACGVARNDLADHTLAAALTLGPQALPPHLHLEDDPGDSSSLLPDPATINLLCGPHEPTAIKRLKRRAGMLITIVMAIVLILALFGMERRRAVAIQSVEQIKAEQDAVVASVILPEASSAFAGPLELQLTAELRRLRQTRAARAPDEHYADITASVIALFSAWPADVHLETESVMIDPQRILIVGRAPSMSEASKVNEQLNTVEGWTIDAPDANKRSDHTAISVSLKPLLDSEYDNDKGPNGGTP